jgi:hypothetical protein
MKTAKGPHPVREEARLAKFGQRIPCAAHDLRMPRSPSGFVGLVGLVSAFTVAVVSAFWRVIYGVGPPPEAVIAAMYGAFAAAVLWLLVAWLRDRDVPTAGHLRERLDVKEDIGVAAGLPAGDQVRDEESGRGQENGETSSAKAVEDPQQENCARQ